MPDHLKEGRKLLAQGHTTRPLAEFNKALEISPYLGEAYFQRGLRPRGPGRARSRPWPTSIRPSSATLSTRTPTSIAAGSAPRRASSDGALADFDQVMIMRPNDAECYLNRGVCLAKKGVLSDAILDFQRVLKLTNHSDFAEPARYYLDQLGGENPLAPPLPVPSTNGSAHAPSPASGQPPLRITCSERVGALSDAEQVQDNKSRRCRQDQHQPASRPVMAGRDPGLRDAGNEHRSLDHHQTDLGMRQPMRG